MKTISTGLFCDSFSPVVDGVTTTVSNYARLLGISFGPATVITPSAPGYIDDEVFTVLRYLSIPTIVRPPYRIGLPHLDARLARTLAKSGFSILHAHSPFGAGHIALETARIKGIPIIATFHSKYRDDLLRVVPIKAVVDREIEHIVDFLYSVDQVWVPQEAVVSVLREYGYRGPYEVVENGIDLAPPPDIEPYRTRGQAGLGVPENSLVGLYVGQHTIEKNIEFLVRSLPKVMEAVPNFRMVFVGRGYARNQMKGLAAKLGFADRIMFHDTVLNREMLKDIYARADLFLFPSFYDNAPLVIREAAAFRTPALLLKESTASEVIDDEMNGFLAENDSQAFSTRIIDILMNPQLITTAGKGAQETLCRSWQDVLVEVQERYMSILSRWV